MAPLLEPQRKIPLIQRTSAFVTAEPHIVREGLNGGQETIHPVQYHLVRHKRQNRTLLITGGTGYLGTQLLRLAREWDLHATLYSTPPPAFPPVEYHRCDLRHFDTVSHLLANLQPDVIIHTACSNQTSHDLDAIVPAAKHLSSAAKTHHSRLIHVSSDVVFDGNHAPYAENDPLNPLSVYGQLKAEAEQLVATHNPEALIVRTSLIYGIDPLDHQSKWLLDGINRGKPVLLFTDEQRSPIWVNTLALALLELAEKSATGILHVAGPQTLNRWDFGHAMLTLLQMPPSSFLTPATIEEAGLVRPKNLSLNVTKAMRLLQTPLLTIKEVTKLILSKA